MRISKGAAVAACFCMLVSGAGTSYAGDAKQEIIKTTAIPSVTRTTGYPKPDAPAISSTYSGLIEDYAEEYGVPVDLAHAIVKVESNFNPKARGSAGEVGLMQ